jgi:tetratricopeptide (TPR) repeat protein
MLWYAWVIPSILLALLIFLYKKHKEYLTGFVIFIAGFVALSGLVSFYFQDWSTVADRYVYISMAGIALAAAYTISKFHKNALILIISGAMIIILALLSYQQTGIWKNELTLWDNNINIYPERSAHAYMGRGLIYSVSGNPQQALSDYNKALELNPKYTRAWYNRGNWYYDIQDYQKAISDFTEAVKLGYNSPSLFVNRGLSYAAINQHELAIADYSKSLSINQNQPDVFVNRGNSYAISGKFESAVADFRKALELNPTDELAKESLMMAENELKKTTIKNESIK